MRDQVIRWLQANYLAIFAPKPVMTNPQSLIENPPPSKKAKLAGDALINDDNGEEDEE